MVDTPTPDDIELATFLKLAGQSFTDAQKTLIPREDVSVNMMLSNAELELRVTVRSDAAGKVMIRPISSEDISRGGIDPGMLSTVRFNFVNTIGELNPAPESTSPTGESENAVPSLIGLTMDAAASLLKSRRWAFESHAASREEISAAGAETRGRVLRQLPLGAQIADKETTTVHVWVNLGSASVTEIDGIGIKLEESLSKAGITTVGELGLANVSEVASALKMSDTRAQSYIDMAGLISRLAILGLRDEVVEVLAKGAGIGSVERLAEADPTKLFQVCQEVVTTGKVRVPREFKFTVDDVKEWVRAASSYLGK